MPDPERPTTAQGMAGRDGQVDALQHRPARIIAEAQILYGDRERPGTWQGARAGQECRLVRLGHHRAQARRQVETLHHLARHAAQALHRPDHLQHVGVDQHEAARAQAAGRDFPRCQQQRGGQREGKQGREPQAVMGGRAVIGTPGRAAAGERVADAGFDQRFAGEQLHGFLVREGVGGDPLRLGVGAGRRAEILPLADDAAVEHQSVGKHETEQHHQQRCGDMRCQQHGGHRADLDDEGQGHEHQRIQHAAPAAHAVGDGAGQLTRLAAEVDGMGQSQRVAVGVAVQVTLQPARDLPVREADALAQRARQPAHAGVGCGSQARRQEVPGCQPVHGRCQCQGGKALHARADGHQRGHQQQPAPMRG